MKKSSGNDARPMPPIPKGKTHNQYHDVDYLTITSEGKTLEQMVNAMIDSHDLREAYVTLDEAIKKLNHAKRLLEGRQREVEETK